MPKKEAGWIKASGYLFLLGILIAIVAGLAKDYVGANAAAITGLEVIIGFIVGLLGLAGVGTLDRADLNIFLIAVVALIAAGGAGSAFSGIMYIGHYLKAIVDYIGIMVIPAAVLMALKAIWQSGSTKI